MALDTLKEFCKSLYHCAEKLEEEIKSNINISQEIITKNETIDIKLPLQKVKIYHYSEIIQIVKAIKIDIRKILYHEQCIKNLDVTKKISEEERERYFSVENINEELEELNKLEVIPRRSMEEKQRYYSVENINHTKPDDQEGVKRRQRRRAVSEISIYTLSTWEAYLQKKDEEEENIVPETAVEKIDIPKRDSSKSKRKQKKFISSTFNDILECDNIDDKSDNKYNSIIEEDEDGQEANDPVDWSRRFLSYSENNLVNEIAEDQNLRAESYADFRGYEDTKPKIVDFVYKKQSDTNGWNGLQTSFAPDSG